MDDEECGAVDVEVVDVFGSKLKLEIFTFMADFETTGVTIDTTSGRTDTTLQILYSPTPDPNIFEGTHSAIAYVDPINIRLTGKLRIFVLLSKLKTKQPFLLEAAQRILEGEIGLIEIEKERCMGV